MAKFVDLNEAARLLGVSPEQLVEMRSSGDIHGYRDGASWKFKEDEIERVREERGAGKSAGGDDGPLPFELGDESDAESILVSEEELGHSGETTSSTVIGKKKMLEGDSDLKLSSDSRPGSDLDFTGDSGLSGLSLDADTGSGLGLSDVGSDVKLSGGDSEVKLSPDPGSDKTLGGGSDVLGDAQAQPSAGTKGGKSGLAAGSSGASGFNLADDSELALSDDDEMVLGSGSDGSDLAFSAGDSGINLAAPSDSGLSLEADSELSLQSKTDGLKMGSAASGLNLSSATDSGLALEDEPLDLAGSAISALELPEDEEAVNLEDLGAGASGVKKDEEFLLSPSDEMFLDESDSGSQVIALEDSTAFGDADMLGGGAPGALLAETGGLDQQLGGLGLGGATPVLGPAAPTGPVVLEPAEAPYSIWNVMGLLMIILFLMVSGVLMSDIMRNMWAWEDGLDVSTSVSTGISDAIFKPN